MSRDFTIIYPIYLDYSISVKNINKFAYYNGSHGVFYSYLI